jgi:ABC-type transport system involved in multi-copper enzyme maturation permease subunit
MKDTFSQKMVVFLCGLLLVLIIGFIFGVHIEGKDGIVGSFSILGGKPALIETRSNEAQIYLGMYGTFGFLVTVLLGLIATAHLLPEAMSNGGIFFFAAKPLSRGTILLGIYSGVAIAMAFIQIISLSLFSIIFSLKACGFQGALFLWIFPLWLVFASMYALVVAVAVMCRSAGIVNSIVIAHVLLLSGALAEREKVIFPLIQNTLGRSVVDGLYYMLPQTDELQKLSLNILSHLPVDLNAVVCSIGSAGVMLILAIAMFRRADL